MSSTGETLDVESEMTTTAIMQSAPSPPSNQAKASAQDDTVGHDSSHLLQELDTSSLDPTTVAQHISENREPSYTKEEPTTSQIRQAPEHSTISSLKHEHSSRTQSPLREFSVPVPSTEMTVSIAPPAPPKRSHKKKGVAAAAVSKRSAVAPPAKRSHKKKVVASSTATPAQSSPAPRSVRDASSPARSSPDADGNGDQHFSGEEGEDEDGGVISDTDLYCICRKPDTGTFMIGCDGGCDDWFHGKCVNIVESWKSLIDKYICPFCTEKGIGETTWKRMCRRDDCGKPALVNKHTKFCSDRCGQLFFQALVAEQTRQPVADTASRARRGHQATVDDLGARGGLISAGELKSVILAHPNVEALHNLNHGPVSPMPGSSPNEPKNEDPEDENSLSHESALNDIERERIDQITHSKATARARHSLLKDRARFIAMLKTVASRLADHRNVKPKDLCGYDSRLTWNDDDFNAWRSSESGQEALSIGSLPLPSTEDIDSDVLMNGTSHPSESPQQSTCMKKRCSRHYEWAKLHIEDNKFEIGLNSNNLQALEKEEGNIIQRARLRAREIRAGGVGGTVEFHGEYLPEKENKEDRELGVAPVVEGTRDVEMKEEGDEQSQKSEEEEAEQKKEGPEELEQKSEDVVAVEEIQEVQEVQEVQEDDGEDKEVDMVDAIAASI
jgi:COMPASS component SPP1